MFRLPKRKALLCNLSPSSAMRKNTNSKSAHDDYTMFFFFFLVFGCKNNKIPNFLRFLFATAATEDWGLAEFYHPLNEYNVRLWPQWPPIVPELYDECVMSAKIKVLHKGPWVKGTFVPTRLFYDCVGPGSPLDITKVLNF